MPEGRPPEWLTGELRCRPWPHSGAEKCCRLAGGRIDSPLLFSKPMFTDSDGKAPLARQADQPVLRVGFVGVGEVTTFKHLEALKRATRVRPVAVADHDPSRLQQIGGTFPGLRRYDSAERLFDDSEVNAVAICVPPAAHVDLAIAALDAGKHVLVEKPLALTMDDCDRLVARAGGSSTKIVMGFHMRFHRLVKRAREFLRAGGVGEVEAIHSVWHAPLAFDYRIPEWRRYRPQGGGAIVELGVHHFDLWRFLLDTEVESVFTRTRLQRAEGRPDEHAFSDRTVAVSATLQNGALATGSFSEGSPHRIEIQVYGARGQLSVDCQLFDGWRFVQGREFPGSPRVRLRWLKRGIRDLPAGLRGLQSGGDYLESYASQWDHFADVVARDLPNYPTIADGRSAVQVILAAAQSASSGRPVDVGEADRTLADPIDASRILSSDQSMRPLSAGYR